MNIKKINGKVIHLQKEGHKTVCGQYLTTRFFDRQIGMFQNLPSFIETSEEITCDKCDAIVKE